MNNKYIFPSILPSGLDAVTGTLQREDEYCG